MAIVELTATEARAIANELKQGIDLMGKSSTGMLEAAHTLYASGMTSLAGQAAVRKQEEINADAQRLVTASYDRAVGLEDYANAVEQGQAAAAAEVNATAV